MPGFIKPVNGNTRMRFVKPGYNPDDYNTPNEHVIFDSEDIGSLCVIGSGEYNWGQGGNSNGNTIQIASFNYGFVPLVYFLYSYDGGVSFGPDQQILGGPGAAADFNAYTRVYSTGIVLSMRTTSTTWQHIIRWYAFDLPVF